AVCEFDPPHPPLYVGHELVLRRHSAMRRTSFEAWADLARHGQNTLCFDRVARPGGLATPKRAGVSRAHEEALHLEVVNRVQPGGGREPAVRFFSTTQGRCWTRIA